MDKSAKSRPIDPILNIPVQSPVTSICFASPKTSIVSLEHDKPDQLQKNADNLNNIGDEYGDDSDSDDTDDSDDDEIEFRSSKIRVPISDSGSALNHSNPILTDRFLASCHSNGEALLWDLQRQKHVGTICSPRDGAGVCIRRTDDPSHVMFQTRDSKGMVSVHSIDRCSDGKQYNGTSFYSEPPKSSMTNCFETYSKTFCRASPCLGNKNLIALPNVEPSTVTVVDTRTNAAVGNYSIENHGMVTSLAFSVSGNGGNGRPILACGMESGTTVFFDIADGTTRSFEESSFSIGKDPVLALDMIQSSPPKSSESSLSTESYTDAVLVAAGMAGDAPDVAELSEDEAGRAVIFKTLLSREAHAWKFKQRARLSTCRVDRETYNGKPGISVCRYRPEDGRLLAIGGWDKRIRLFERTKGNMVALLKGSKGSIVDLDWAPDAMTSGLIASADKDEKLISLWQCFPNQ